MRNRWSWIMLCALIMSSSTSCVYQFGGAEIYEATAWTQEGKEFVKQYQVKYICPEVYGLYWADIHRSAGVFAIDVRETDDGKIAYKAIEEKYVLALGLEPKFSWWNRNGKYFALIIVLGLIVFWLKALSEGYVITPSDD